MVWIYLIGCLLLLPILWWYYLFFKYGRYYTNYKGPTPLPFTGNLHKIRSPVDTIPVFMEFHKNFGSVVTVWFGYRPRLLISDYKVIEFLLSSPTILEKSKEYNFLKPWLGTGLLTSSGLKWKRQRKLLTPAFHFSILEQFVEIFHAQSDILVQKLLLAANNKAFDIYPYITLCALDIICEATMGTQVNAQRNAESDYVKSVKAVCRIVVERSFSLKMFNIFYVFSRDYWKEMKALSVLHGYSESVINSRKNNLENKRINGNTNVDDLGRKKRMAFLDLLIQCTVDGKPLPKDVIQQEVDTFMFEGHDTITSGISFIMYSLSIHPDIQAKVVEELYDVLGNDKDAIPTYQNLQDLKYLEMVIKESLRLYPSVPFYGRKITEDITFDGTVFPKGSMFTMFIYGLHRQEDIYPDPEKFDPERFTPINSSNRSPFAYVPFSAGPRNCIGQRFAMIEMKSIILRLLQRFEILPVPEYKPSLSAESILRSTNGIWIRLKERQLRNED